MASVIAVWATLAAVASALLYLPHLPGGFVYGDGVPQRGDFAEALYVSMVTLSTVGFGEIVAADPLLRLVAALQARQLRSACKTRTLPQGWHGST